MRWRSCSRLSTGCMNRLLRRSWRFSRICLTQWRCLPAPSRPGFYQSSFPPCSPARRRDPTRWRSTPRCCARCRRPAITIKTSAILGWHLPIMSISLLRSDAIPTLRSTAFSRRSAWACARPKSAGATRPSPRRRQSGRAPPSLPQWERSAPVRTVTRPSICTAIWARSLKG